MLFFSGFKCSSPSLVKFRNLCISTGGRRAVAAEALTAVARIVSYSNLSFVIVRGT
jgi:hypothetical protein